MGDKPPSGKLRKCNGNGDDSKMIKRLREKGIFLDAPKFGLNFEIG